MASKVAIEDMFKKRASKPRAFVARRTHGAFLFARIGTIENCTGEAENSSLTWPREPYHHVTMSKRSNLLELSRLHPHSASCIDR